MKQFVVDTSVTLAWYLEEVFSEQARIWQENLLNEEISLLAPGLHLLEFANVLRTLVKRKVLSHKLAHTIYELHLLAPIEILDSQPQHLLNTALRYDATVYDASFIQLALDLEIPFVTAEKPTTGWVQQLGDLAIPIR